MANQTKKKLEKELLKLWFQRSLEKWGDRCTICGRKATQMHHFIPRSRSRLLKYDVENAVPLCQSCHYKIHFSSNPNEIHRLVEIIRKRRGKKWCDYIDEREKRPKASLGIKWLEEQKQKLTK